MLLLEDSNGGGEDAAQQQQPEEHYWGQALQYLDRAVTVQPDTKSKIFSFLIVLFRFLVLCANAHALLLFCSDLVGKA